MRCTALFVALTLFIPVVSFGVEDTTPPVLVDFTISPTVFDAGLGNVAITSCVTAADLLNPDT
jgi:hypothetical protein